MAKYFEPFKKLAYNLSDNVNTVKVTTNILQRSSFLKEVLDNSAIAYEYEVKDTDTPEIIAHKLYGDQNRHWIVLMYNQIHNPYYQFPIRSDLIDKYIENKYGYSAANAKSTIHHYEKVITKKLYNPYGTLVSSNTQTFALSNTLINADTGSFLPVDASLPTIANNDIAANTVAANSVTTYPTGWINLAATSTNTSITGAKGMVYGNGKFATWSTSNSHTYLYATPGTSSNPVTWTARNFITAHADPSWASHPTYTTAKTLDWSFSANYYERPMSVYHNGYYFVPRRSIFYSTSYTNQIARVTLHRSSNIIDWETVYTLTTTSTPAFQSISEIQEVVANNNTLLFSLYNKETNNVTINKSTSNGSSWTTVFEQPWANVNNNTKLLYDDLNQSWYAFFDSDKLFTSNDATTWTENLSYNPPINRGEFSMRGNTIITSYTGNIKRSTNLGQNWVNLGSFGSGDFVHIYANNDMFALAGEFRRGGYSTNVGETWNVSTVFNPDNEYPVFNYAATTLVYSKDHNACFALDFNYVDEVLVPRLYRLNVTSVVTTTIDGFGGSDSVSFPDGSELVLTETNRAVSVYDYEYELNESRRKIKLIDAFYIPQIEKEFKKIMEQ